MSPNRRQWILSMAAAWGAGSVRTAAAPRSQQSTGESSPCPLALTDFEPASMLKVAVTQVEKARFPVIDIHTHLSGVDRRAPEPLARHRATPDEVLSLMDRHNLRYMVNLTGGYGAALDQTLAYWKRPHPDRFVVFTEPWFSRFEEEGYPDWQAGQIEWAARQGAGGLKLTKALGLYLRESGKLVKVDDRRLDPMWEAAGSAGIPVAIHTSDPEAFFLPIDRHNERFEELNAHPDWSFHGRDFPSSRELHEARNRVIARHPKTQFILLHLGVSEDLQMVSNWLDNHPNMSVEFGARIGELGRQPRAAAKFFDRYQDRILFGTDAVPQGYQTPQQVFTDQLYEIYFRFLEPDDEYFDYEPAPVPPQGRWKIYGLKLPDQILRKVYYENAARLLNLRL